MPFVWLPIELEGLKKAVGRLSVREEGHIPALAYRASQMLPTLSPNHELALNQMQAGCWLSTQEIRSPILRCWQNRANLPFPSITMAYCSFRLSSTYPL